MKIATKFVVIIFLSSLYHIKAFEGVKWNFTDNVQRVDARSISKEEFVEKYEKPLIPVVLTHVTETWAAREKWTAEKLSKVV